MFGLFKKDKHEAPSEEPMPFKCSGCGSTQCYQSGTVFDVVICVDCGLLFQSWRNAEYARKHQ